MCTQDSKCFGTRQTATGAMRHSELAYGLATTVATKINWEKPQRQRFYHDGMDSFGMLLIFWGNFELPPSGLRPTAISDEVYLIIKNATVFTARAGYFGLNSLRWLTPLVGDQTAVRAGAAAGLWVVVEHPRRQR